MPPTRQQLHRFVREEILRAVEEERRAREGRPRPGEAARQPTHAILMTGRAGLSDRMAKVIGDAVRTGCVGWLAGDDDFLATACGRRLADRLGLETAAMPPVYCPGNILWDSRQMPAMHTLWALPISLSSLGGLVGGTLAAGGRALHGALARRWCVTLTGHPHLAESLPPLKPGDALAAQERDLLAAAVRMGCEQRTLGEIEREVKALAGRPASGRPGAPVGSFYTVHDVEDLARAGATEIVVDPRTRITPLAEDRARELGLRVIRAE